VNRSLLVLASTFLIGFSVLLLDQHTMGSLQAAEQIRIGLIGLDSSHAVAFTKLINQGTSRPEFENVKIVAAFPGGSPDLSTSVDRIEGFTKTVSELGVEIMPSIESMLKKVDAVIINSVDGRVHLAQATPVLEAGLPLFIDKPVTASVQDSISLFELAKKTGTPVFSCSTLRYCAEVIEAEKLSQSGQVTGCISYSPCKLDPTHPDLYWYGIHGVETLFVVMGPGCQSVQRTKVDGVDVVTGIWKDGRVGTFRGIRDGAHNYGMLLFTKKGVEQIKIKPTYDQLVVEIVHFFRTKKAPVSAEETLEIMAFMTAADASRDTNGQRVTLESVMSAKK
jgi:hypothetical protein